MDHLSIFDYTVFSLSLLLSFLIGVYYWRTGGRQRTNREYLLADQSMNVWVVSVSLMASFMSAITLLGVPAEVYTFGAIFFYINISYIIGTPICAFFFLPVFFRLKCTSAYEYLEMRFNKTVRTIASLTFMIQMIVYMGIVLYAPALALSAVTGLSKWPSIFAVSIVCTLYCCFGGIKAVLWTDFFQSGLMFLALIAVGVAGAVEVGGMAEVFNRASSGGRLNFNNFSVDPTTRHSFWSLTIGGIFIYVSIYGVNQTQVQRLLTVKNLKRAQIALFLSWPVTSLLSLTCVLTGMIMYAFYQECDPILMGKVDKPDQLLPLFMMRVLGDIPGLPGLFIAGIFSGSLSSVSSFVNSLAAVTLEDFLKPILRSRGIRWGEEKETIITKILAFVFGVICLLLTVVAEKMTGILEASLTIFGVVGGPLLGLFTLGMMGKTCSSKAAIISFLFSLAVGFWIGFGSIKNGDPPVALEKGTSMCSTRFNWSVNNVVPPSEVLTTILVNDSSSEDTTTFYLYRLSYMYVAGLTFFIEILLGHLLSWTIFPNRKLLKSTLISPVVLALFGRERKENHPQEMTPPPDSTNHRPLVIMSSINFMPSTPTSQRSGGGETSNGTVQQK